MSYSIRNRLECSSPRYSLMLRNATNSPVLISNYYCVAEFVNLPNIEKSEFSTDFSRNDGKITVREFHFIIVSQYKRIITAHEFLFFIVRQYERLVKP